MLIHGSRVLGLMADNKTIERVILFAIKRLLNISAITSNQLVYGKRGKYPLYISSYTRFIKYWLNILWMQEDLIPLKSYKTLYNMHCNNDKKKIKKNHLVSSVCFTLYRYRIVENTQNNICACLCCAKYVNQSVRVLVFWKTRRPVCACVSWDKNPMSDVVGCFVVLRQRFSTFDLLPHNRHTAC